MSMIESLTSKAIFDVARASAQRLFGGKIKITSPRPLESLTGGEEIGTMIAFTVRGTLKHLPKDHEIWLLIEEPSGRVWPQGFYSVQFNPESGAWMGKFNGANCREVKIVAVVAPPTSQDYFRYFQTVGVNSGYRFEPLNRRPPECWNTAYVQAVVTKVA